MLPILAPTITSASRRATTLLPKIKEDDPSTDCDLADLHSEPVAKKEAKMKQRILFTTAALCCVLLIGARALQAQGPAEKLQRLSQY